MTCKVCHAHKGRRWIAQSLQHEREVAPPARALHLPCYLLSFRHVDQTTHVSIINHMMTHAPHITNCVRVFTDGGVHWALCKALARLGLLSCDVEDSVASAVGGAANVGLGFEIEGSTSALECVGSTGMSSEN